MVQLPFHAVAMPTLKAKPTNQPQTTKKATKKTPTAPSQVSGQEIWDELLETPESEAFLTMLVAEVRQERQSGKLIEGEWK
jgi:hypothetical protein